MAVINTAIQLANIRSKIDAQQQVVSLLEAELQKAILGDDNTTVGDVLEGGTYVQATLVSGHMVPTPGATPGSYVPYTGTTDPVLSGPGANAIFIPDPNSVKQIYSTLVGPQSGQGNSYGDGFDLYEALKNPIVQNFGGGDEATALDASLDQTVIRQILYQARALLGELRVEEQHWNQEVNEEKARRKDLAEFAKGG